MTHDVYIYALLGGMLIGLSATALLALDGHVMGMSGIVGNLFKRSPGDRSWRWFFVLGVLGVGFIASRLWPSTIGQSPASAPLLVLAGLLVGFGTQLGKGCTTGHGVCGLSRWSMRSLVATLIFMASAFITVNLLYR